MSLADIREALAAAVSNVVECTPYVTDQVNTPQGVIVRREVTYKRSFDGESRYQFTISVYATRSPEYGQQFLDELVEPEGPTSLKEAVESDAGVGAAAHYATVNTASPVLERVVGETTYLAVDFDVEVVA